MKTKQHLNVQLSSTELESLYGQINKPVRYKFKTKLGEWLTWILFFSLGVTCFISMLINSI